MTTLTIFTPTYNRAYTITNLYKSLKRQTSKDFEWLVVDDGSADNTAELIEGFISEACLDIKFIRKENGGKHTAANVALEKASGEIFFVVDSDDYLSDNAVERILHHYSEIEDKEDFCGVCGLKAFFNGDVIGSEIDYSILNTTIIDYRFYRKVEGDKADVFKTNILREYKFPTHVDEKWCPLSIVWNRFGSKLKVRYFNEVLYYADYRDDGISLNRNATRRNSPRATSQYYRELSEYNVPLAIKIKALINYWRFGLYVENGLLDLVKGIGIKKSLFTFFPGLVFHYIDRSKILGDIFLSPKKTILNRQLRS